MRFAGGITIPESRTYKVMDDIRLCFNKYIIYLLLEFFFLDLLEELVRLHTVETLLAVVVLHLFVR